MHKKNFKFYRPVVVSSLIFILGFVTINILHFEADSRTFQKKLFDSILPTSADYISAYIESFNSKYALLSKVLAAETDPDSFIINGREDSRAVITRLRDISEKTSVKTTGYISFLTDKYYDSNGTVLELDYNSERDSWITEFLNSGADTKSTFYDPEDNEHLFAIYNDVKISGKEGSVDAIFGLGVSFGSATEDINKAGENKTIFFIDTSGMIKFPSNMRGKNIYDRYIIDRNNYELSSHNHSQYENVIYLSEDNKKVVFYSEYISFLGKFMIIELDITEIYDDLKTQFLSSFIAGLILSAGIVIGNIFILNHSNNRHFKKAYKDPLTGCYNRRFLDHCFSGSRTGFSTGSTSLITLDIDHFKEINDKRGHLEGDVILKTVASVAQSCVRDKDAVIRWGGDEFILLVKADIDDTFRIAERIRSELYLKTAVSITAGVTSIGKDDIFETAMERADSALYKAKNEGRNRVYTA